MKYIIQYEDGAFERRSGFPVVKADATIFDSKEAAEAHAKNLVANPKVVMYDDVMDADTIAISRGIAQALVEHIRAQLFEYDYYSNGSDYRCNFCRERAKSNASMDIEHDKDCEGLKFLAELEKHLG